MAQPIVAAAPPPPHSPMPTVPLRSHRVVGVVVVQMRVIVAVVAAVVWESPAGAANLLPFLVRFRFPFLVLVRFGCVRENFLQTRPSPCLSPNSDPPIPTPLCDPFPPSCFPFSVQILSRAILMKSNRPQYLQKMKFLSKKKRDREGTMKSVREMR